MLTNEKNSVFDLLDGIDCGVFINVWTYENGEVVRHINRDCEHYANGNPKCVFEYEDGELYSMSEYYETPAHTIQALTVYKNGKMAQKIIYNKNGSVIQRINYDENGNEIKS